MLKERDILYAPDYAADAGGIINGSIEVPGWERALKKVDEIYDTLLTISEIAQTDKLPTDKVADRLAEEQLRKRMGGTYKELVTEDKVESK